MTLNPIKGFRCFLNKKLTLIAHSESLVTDLYLYVDYVPLLSKVKRNINNKKHTNKQKLDCFSVYSNISTYFFSFINISNSFAKRTCLPLFYSYIHFILFTMNSFSLSACHFIFSLKNMLLFIFIM